MSIKINEFILFIDLYIKKLINLHLFKMNL